MYNEKNFVNGGRKFMNMSKTIYDSTLNIVLEGRE